MSKNKKKKSKAKSNTNQKVVAAANKELTTKPEVEEVAKTPVAEQPAVQAPEKEKKEKSKAVEVKVKDVAAKEKKKKDKKPNKLVKSLKDTGNELKKVTWPKFKDVVKQTGVVLAVVVVFAIVLFGIDKLCSLLTGLLF